MRGFKIVVMVGFLMTSFSMPVVAEVATEEHAGEGDAHAQSSHGEASHGEASHGEGHGAHGINWIDLSNSETPPLVPMFFNFMVVVFLVYFMLRKGLGSKIRNRRTELESALAEAKALKTEAEEAMAIAKKRSEALEAEMAQIRSDILEAAQAHGIQIEKEAAARAERMDGESTALIAQEISMLSQDIRKEAVEQIVSMAQERIVEKITKADHDKMAKEYLESVMSSVQDAK